MRKLKQSELATERARMLKEQGGVCRLCSLPLPLSNAVVDHDHTTGLVRAVLHRGCNSLLGKVENNAARYGVKNIPAFGHGLARYVQDFATDRTGLIHPKHKTPDEKRIARNAKARKARANKKTKEPES